MSVLKRSIGLSPPKIFRWTLFFIPVSIFIAVMFARMWDNLANTDFMTLWLAGKSIIQGFDPYDPGQWVYWRETYGATRIFDTRFIFPLPLRFFLTPLGLIGLYPAYLLWLTAAFPIILISVLLLHKQGRQEISMLEMSLLVTGVILFRPTWTSLNFGQIGCWILAALVATILLWDKKRWLAGGIVLSLTILKPTIGGPFLLLVIPWLLMKKRWRAILGLLAGGIGLLVIGILDNPAWVFIFLQSGEKKMGDTFGYAPNLWGLGRVITNGRAVIPVGAILSILVIGLGIFIVFRNREHLTPFAFFSLITPIVVLTTPYLWAYDQLYLLIPLSYFSLKLYRSSKFSQVGVLTFPAAALLSYLVVLPALKLNFDYFSALLPLVVLAAYLVAQKPSGSLAEG